MLPANAGPPRLVVLEPAAYRGRLIELRDGENLLGRGDSCDVHFDDPYLSRSHAVLRRRGDVVHIEDLRSSAGTTINGAFATGARELRSGDVVGLADLRLRYEGVRTAQAAETAPYRAVGYGSGAVAYGNGDNAARYDVGQQHGQNISNIGRDQYNSYVQQVTQQRESFLREIAATRTKARWLVWLGLLIFVAGFALFAAPLLGFIGQVSDAIESGDTGPPEDPFGPDVAGVPLALVGWALAAVGTLMLGIGIVLHIVAASRRRRVDRELAVPPPWQMAGPRGG